MGGPSSLRDVFLKYDANQNGTLELQEFEEALSAFG
jgi:Ca2+-binding EF-hand superfamily protein